jgi:hypothetical protein
MKAQQPAKNAAMNRFEPVAAVVEAAAMNNERKCAGSGDR